MSNAFTIVGILAMIIFSITMIGMVNNSLTTDDIVSTGSADLTATQELGTFGTILNFVFPENFSNSVENAFGFIGSALSFKIEGTGAIGNAISIVIWLFIIALIWIIVELMRGV